MCVAGHLRPCIEIETLRRLRGSVDGRSEMFSLSSPPPLFPNISSTLNYPALVIEVQSPHLSSYSLSLLCKLILSPPTTTSSLQYSLRTIASVDGIGPQAPAPIPQTPSIPPSFTPAIHTTSSPLLSVQTSPLTPWRLDHQQPIRSFTDKKHTHTHIYIHTLTPTQH